MFVKLDHPLVEVYVNPEEISHLEHAPRPKTSLTLQDESKYYTHLSLKNGKVLSVSNTPEEVFARINELNVPK